jgi:F-type H+-transporting ATPase subunit alpha
MSTFAQFGTADLDKATRAQLELGQRITEILKQPQYVPVPMEKQVMILYTVTNGYLDDVPVNSISSAEEAFYRFMDTNHPEIGKTIAAEKELSDATEEALKKAIIDCKQHISFADDQSCILHGEKTA